MSISTENFYHGAALAKLVSSAEFTVLSRDDSFGRGGYRVNQTIGLFIKYSTHNSSWQFTFQAEHQHSLREMLRLFPNKTYIALVCGEKGICLLSYGDYATVINENFTTQESITVDRPPRGCFRVRGSQGELDHTIPENRYPTDLFS